MSSNTPPAIVPKGHLSIEVVRRDDQTYFDAIDQHEDGISVTCIGFIDAQGNHVPKDLCLLLKAYCDVANYVELTCGESLKDPQMRK